MRRRLSIAKRAIVHAKYGGRCAYCGRSVSLEGSRTYRMQVDHFVPLAKGGTDEISNLFPACHECNRWKADLTIDEFRQVCLAAKNDAPHFTAKQRAWLKANLIDIERKLITARGPIVFLFEGGDGWRS